jgi:hypothetical protein
MRDERECPAFMRSKEHNRLWDEGRGRVLLQWIGVGEEC